MVNRGWTQPRPALDRRLDGALTHRLTTLIAATGYGKSTLLSGWVHAVAGCAMVLIKTPTLEPTSPALN